MTCPPLMPPPATATLKTLGKWSRPRAGVDLGCAAELTHPDDQRPIEHALLFQIGDQGCESRVNLLGQLAHAVVVLLVRVPAVGPDLDEGHARLNQATSEQAALAERGAAIRVAKRFGFPVQVERAHIGRKDHLRGLLVKRGGREPGQHPHSARTPPHRGGRANPGDGESGPTATFGSVLSGGLSGFWTTNGSIAAPRNPAPIVAPPILTMWGKSKWLSPISPTTEQPMCGCLTVADGT